MELTSAALGDVPMIVVSGEVDHTTCGALQATLDRTIASGYSVVFLDLSDVLRVSSAGFSALTAPLRALRWGWLGVIGPNADIRRRMEAEGLLADPRIRVFETRQAARVATGERAST